MNVKKFAGKTAIVGALSAAALGLGTGMAQAHPGPWPVPPGPHVVDNGHGNPLPPGQVKQLCPWQAPPGHWVGGPHGVPCT
ncbi:hypothetical protein A5675_25495 [Mycobacterium malmoense]|uniref:hypothetical protein n=1 Tax=Mycobacterium malmoense TaxID=1780 RepID=UPI00080B5021|nr:hypothetical protein [Mycobacterium malmoense]OCB18603.1 hypothetical protein A5674_08905 [Mycobacterium malmoense]OCB31828.1 hypothetical protein A5675_25495 [Mycobacterium malmoense]OCB39306.1 hypothetical protein A5676_14110 [Mycobacterium malmoense]